MLDVGFASLALRVEGPVQWLAPLAQAWRAWSPQEKTPSWSVVLEADATLALPTAPLFDTLPRCQGTVCQLVAPGFRGTVCGGQELALQRAHLRAHLRAHPHATPGDVGYFLRIALAVQAYCRQGLLFHAAGIVHHSRAYALFGRSGSGKTTAARLSAPDPVLNDDLLFLAPAAGGWTAYGTPFGKRRGELHAAPLRALLWLVQDHRVFVEPMDKARALAEVIANTPVLSGDVDALPGVMARWQQVMTQVPVAALHFRRDPTFWEVIDAYA